MKFTAVTALVLASVAAAAPAPRADLGTAIADTAIAGVFNPADLGKTVPDIVNSATGGLIGGSKAEKKED